MPLEPIPPPSPHGKTPPPKHQCSSTAPCPLRLSEVGCQYYQFPKGTFWACFSPPTLPQAVASYFAKHPPIWTWSVKAGPNEGKSFQVPTIPIACDKQKPPTCSPLSPLAAEVVALHVELDTLKEKLYNYISTHEACCQHSNSPKLSSSEDTISNDGEPPAPQATPTSPPFRLLIQQEDGIMVPDPNPPSWLTTVLSHIDLPPSYSGVLYSLEHLLNHLPHDATDVLKLHFCGSPPFCLAVHIDRSLCIMSLAHIDCSSITNHINLPPDPSVPTAQC
ncbi:hypothetical protein EV401DRAFT_2081592 [Pisolithus croceorrhizus]|nr:hypothetical protein EV401DRAFT_2081592 [Pisolithus croceorrhizus]